MALLALTDVSLAHGGPAILDHVAFQIEEGERIGFLGRNASGKSTLLSVIAGDVLPDDGEVARKQGLTVAYLPQEVPRKLSGTVRALIASGTRAGEESWRTRERTARLVQGLRLDPEAEVATLSAGLSRRVLLARALVGDPDLLLLDEPTNHLDLPTIDWLERHLLERGAGGRPGSLLFVTHDRAFLKRLATRILEIDRGRLTSWPGDYTNYLRRQEERKFRGRLVQPGETSSRRVDRIDVFGDARAVDDVDRWTGQARHRIIADRVDETVIRPVESSSAKGKSIADRNVRQPFQ